METDACTSFALTAMPTLAIDALHATRLLQEAMTIGGVSSARTIGHAILSAKTAMQKARQRLPRRSITSSLLASIAQSVSMLTIL